MKTDFSQVLWFYLVPRKKWLKLSTECQEIIFSHICLSSYQFDKIQILTYCTFKLFTWMIQNGVRLLIFYLKNVTFSYGQT